MVCRSHFCPKFGCAVIAISMAHKYKDAGCWGDGQTYPYHLCCGCGNSEGNRTGWAPCWVSGFTLESCCTAYDETAALPDLPCWQDARGPKYVVDFTISGTRWQVLQWPVEPFTVNDVLSYVVWPSAYAIAAWLSDLHTDTEPLNGKRVIELGCGVGVGSLVAAHLGAQVLATDIDPLALALAGASAARNLDPLAQNRFNTKRINVSDQASLVMLEPFDIVLLAGFFYDAEVSQDSVLFAISSLCSSTCSLIIVIGGARQLTSDFFYGFPRQLHMLRALEDRYVLRQAFVCSSEGYTAPWSGFGCFRYEVSKQNDIAISKRGVSL